MFYQLRLFKGIFSPSYIAHQLSQAEAIPGFWIRIIFLTVSSGLLSFLGAYFGLGTELLSHELIDLTSSEFESKKLLFILGETLWGLFFTVFYLLFPALFFWSVTEVPLRKLVTVQMFSFLVLLAAKWINMILALALGLDEFSSPFSFGIMMQYMTDHDFFVMLFGSISIFHFFIIYLQFIFLKRLSEKKPLLLFSFILAINAFLLIVSAILHYIRLERLL